MRKRHASQYANFGSLQKIYILYFLFVLKMCFIFILYFLIDLAWRDEICDDDEVICCP